MPVTHALCGITRPLFAEQLKREALLPFQIPRFSFRFQVSGFRFRSTNVACYTHVHVHVRTCGLLYIRSRIFSKKREPQDAHPAQKMHSQSGWVSISGFDFSSAYEASDFRKGCSEGPRFRNELRFQVSDWRQGVELKSRFRFQVSGFRLAQGGEN